jgi:4a-hydroxytetrahydrobiopterin dehydratase
METRTGNTAPGDDAPSIPAGWRWVERPPSLFRRFEFDAYAGTRAFLQDLETLSKQRSFYPDLGFGPRHVNVTVHVEGALAPTVDQCAFAAAAAALAAAVQGGS